MQIEFLSSPAWQRTHPGGDYTAAKGLETRVPQTLPPTQSVNAQGNQAAGDGVIALGAGGAKSPTVLNLLPYAKTASGTLNIQVIGWRATNLGISPPRPLWIPVLLAKYAVVIAASGCTGVAGADITNAYLFGVTITSTVGPTFITTGAAPICADWFQLSPGGTAQAGMISQRTFGFPYLEIMLDTNTGTSGAANCLWCTGGAI